MQIQPQQVVTQSQVTPQYVQGIMTTIMMVWMAVYVLKQVVNLFKGEEVEPPYSMR